MKLLKDMMLMAAGGAMVLMYQKYSKPVMDAASDAMSSMSKKIDDMVK
jgi:hypothetical protein